MGSKLLNFNEKINMWIGTISLFPEMFKAVTDYGVTSKAIKNGLLKITNWNPRSYTHNQYRSIDSRPYGGGAGMVMKVQPLLDAIDAAKKAATKKTRIIYLSPQGQKLNQHNTKNLLSHDKLILVCGRYSGIDERVIKNAIDEEWSIGDYILSGGELAAMVLIDVISRLITGVLGNKASSENDSFSHGLLQWPHYTRPQIFQKMTVPSILLSGNHYKIQRWRKKQSLGQTWLKRPELLKQIVLSLEQRELLTEFKNEYIEMLKML